MNIGRERTTGKIILAGSSAAARHRRYVCPECSAPLVYHEETAYKVAFFGHLPHTADPDCDLYFAPFNSDCQHLAAERVFRLREPVLRLRITGIKGNGLRWQICILVPKFERATSFSLEGSNAYGRVNVSALKEGGTPFVVSPQSDDYALTVFEPDQLPDRLAIEGLTGITFFHLTPGLCRRLGPSEELVRGEAYLIVHRDPAMASLAPAALQTRSLIPIDGWLGQAFRIPRYPTQEVFQWLSSQLGKALADEKATASVLVPLDGHRLDDETWMVRPGAPLVIATFDFGSTEACPPALTLVHGNGEPPEEIILPTDRRAYVQLENLAAGFHEIRRPTDGLALLTVLVAPSGRAIACGGVYFIFSGKDGPHKEYLWSKDLDRWFEAVSLGISALVDIAVPPMARVVIHTGRGAQRRTTFIEGGDTVEAGLHAGVEFKQLVESELTTSSPALEIDADGFGHLVFPAKLQPAQVGLATRIPRHLSKRLAWLTLSGAVPGGPRAFRGVPNEDFRLRAQVRQLRDRMPRARFHEPRFCNLRLR